ncbi:AfsR/SARP family transcriptional regulator [Streptomyces nanshensis]|uniref:Regulator n=1 Tax=Streptomyces nanshensis TaxID=518642 RepID=A0A1E7KUV1_9ACTN|nr:BTAD domain-containing putative transcriptional regulator [Streptomyces nanshensis]OEV07704.1 regulator [Streptomyces nanshensis]
MREASGALSGAARSARLRFSVLGPLRAWRGDQELSLGSPQQRAVLAALLLRNEPVDTEELCDAVWGEYRPPRGTQAVRTYMSRIRKALGGDSGLLVYESGRYALRRSADVVVDLDVVLDLTARAEEAESADQARALYDSALAHWDGTALAHVPGPYAEAQRARLSEWRLSLQERRLELDLQAGRYADAVTELTYLTVAHPLRERLREMLMLALYRSGRQAEALAVYADIRRLLVEELGIDPRPELSELQQRILTADESLNQGAEESADIDVVRRPAQLPGSVFDFTGREGLVRELVGKLVEPDSTVTAISANAGVGKTTLAVHAANEAAEYFPDGQLYADLHGAGPSAADPGAVLGAFLRSLGTADAGVPDGLSERAALFRSLLTGRRVLLLLDNARDAAQIRPLLPPHGSVALVTSRTRMVDLAGAHLLDLDVMSPDEAMALFTRIVGEERVLNERTAAFDVVGACGFLPLAIRIAASRLAARRTWTVSVLASKLVDGRRRLDELQAGDQAVKATFELGYGQLDPGQARAFRLLGLADGPDISLDAAAALLGLSADTTEFLLESLVDTSLLESAAPGRYRFHDLVRLFARACAERDESEESEREAALSRLLDFYLATAAEVYRLQKPQEPPIGEVDTTAVDGLTFSGQSAAVDWIFSESSCFLSCVRQLASGTTLRRAADLLVIASHIVDAGFGTSQYEQAAEAVKQGAQTAEDVQAEARARSVLSTLHMSAGRFDRADAEARVTASLGISADDPVFSAYAANNRGIVADFQGRHDEAKHFLEQARSLFQDNGRALSEASVLCDLSLAHVGLDRAADAKALAEEALSVFRRFPAGSPAKGLYALGVALTASGAWEEAEKQLSEALAMFRRSRQSRWEGMVHFRLAETHLRQGEAARAAAQAEQALAMRGIGGDWHRATVLVTLGKALYALAQRDRAKACWRAALAVFEERTAPEAAEVRRLLETSTTGAAV